MVLRENEELKKHNEELKKKVEKLEKTLNNSNPSTDPNSVNTGAHHSDILMAAHPSNNVNSNLKTFH